MPQCLSHSYVMEKLIINGEQEGVEKISGGPNNEKKWGCTEQDLVRREREDK